VAFADLGETHRLTLRNGVLIHRPRTERDGEADAVVTAAAKLRLIAFLAGDEASPGIEITGDASALARLTAVLDAPDPSFDIVLP